MEELLTKKEAARFFRVDVRTIDSWRKKGLRCIKVFNGKVLFRLEDLKQFAKRWTQQPAEGI